MRTSYRHFCNYRVGGVHVLCSSRRRIVQCASTFDRVLCFASARTGLLSPSLLPFVDFNRIGGDKRGCSSSNYSSSIVSLTTTAATVCENEERGSKRPRPKIQTNRSSLIDSCHYSNQRVTLKDVEIVLDQRSSKPGS